MRTRPRGRLHARIEKRVEARERPARVEHARGRGDDRERGERHVRVVQVCRARAFC
jgi:hypothetical protein